MNLNPHINVDTESNPYVDKFYPDEGYAMWRDNEEANLDENGQPMQYYLQYNCQKRFSESEAPHIWAQLIDDTMEVYGRPSNPEAATYTDENGVEREKKGVY